MILAFKLKIISNPEIADHKHHWSRADIAALTERNGMRCDNSLTIQLGLICFASFSKQTQF